MLAEWLRFSRARCRSRRRCRARGQDAAQRVVVKLRDGSDATLERGDLVARRTDLAPLRRALAERGVGTGRFTPTFSRSPDALRAERSRAERRSGRRLADLALYFTVDVPAGVDPAELAASLRALPLVESAAPWPKLAPPPVDIDPPTPDFTALQTYTAAAPAGIGSAALRRRRRRERRGHALRRRRVLRGSSRTRIWSCPRAR